MKKIQILMVAMVTLFLSCNSATKSISDAKSVAELRKMIVSKFGEDAYYTEIEFADSDIGVLSSVTVTKDPESLKMEKWSNTKGSWTKESDVTLQIPSGSKASDYMFQLDKKIDFNLLGKLVEKSINQVIKEKKIDPVKVSLISMTSPNDGNFEKMRYLLNLNPKNGGTTFTFFYNLDGSLNDSY